MIYMSTRGGAERIPASKAVLAGLAPDGGLYAPASIVPSGLAMAELTGLDKVAITARIVSRLIDDLPESTIAAAVSSGYAGKFDSPDITPLVRMGKTNILQLYHGPTSAFKDMALLILPRLMAASRAANHMEGDVLILTATSGDTGTAALSGFMDAPHARIMVFYPDGGVSDVQRAQMVTQEGSNVAVCGVRGDFDDAQRGVKAVFAAAEGERLGGMSLSSANSINIGRLAPQVAYYFTAYADMVKAGRVKAGNPVDFVVPTGNFGNILSGYLAKRMGLPVGKLVCASNANDVLSDFLSTGRYDRRRTLVRTASPSMDILVSSNLERALYFLSDGDAALVASLMRKLSSEGVYDLPPALFDRFTDEFAPGSADDAAAFSAIRRVWEEHHYLMDPHTAVAWCVMEQYEKTGANPTVVLSTASPYKFASAELKALGLPVPESGFDAMDALFAATHAPIPKNLAALRGKRERHADVIDPSQIVGYVRERAGEASWAE